VKASLRVPKKVVLARSLSRDPPLSPTAYPGVYVLWQSILIVRNVPTVDKHMRGHTE
jgi:hypothetical protein